MTQADTQFSTSPQESPQKNGEDAKSTSVETIYSHGMANKTKKLEGRLFNREVIEGLNRWPQHPPEKDASNATPIRNERSNASINITINNRLGEITLPRLSPEALKRFRERPQHPPEKDA